MSIIERSALQELGQSNGSDETEQRPGHSDIEIKILPGVQTEEPAKSHDNYA
jgi:hypothetical protein